MTHTSTCEALWQDNRLTLRNAHFCEIWRLESDGQLRLVSFRRTGGPEWISSKTPARPAPDGDPLSMPAPDAAPQSWTAVFSTRRLECFGNETPVLVAELRVESSSGVSRTHSFQLHPDVAGVLHQTAGSEIDDTLREIEAPASDKPDVAAVLLTGKSHTKNNGQMFITPPSIAHPLFALASRHLIVRDVQFVDQTDHHSNLVFERELLTHSGERCLPLKSNLVCIENPASQEGEGFLWLLVAPLRRVRERWSPLFDFLLAFQSGGLVGTACPAGYALARVAYCGGRTGATLALQSIQRAFYQAVPHRPGLLLSNTWGDRAGAKNLSEKFVLDEIAAARELGVEVVQIDDGWQRGATVNTPVAGNQGVWNGFWAADSNFWDTHETRFPRGLAPLVEAAEAAGVKLGLWYAPDSTGDLANWERDATRILAIWREHRVDYFKLDAVKLHTRLAETRFNALCDRIGAESGGKITIDFDATAENRPTYWGRLGGGPVFLENRFTEKATYYPHQTLRALWTLGHYMRTERLRIEFLNPTRNDADYAGDPLRPMAYPPEYLFAIAMPCAPLAWFENSKVPAEIAARWRPLIALWKEHRGAFQSGTVIPIGKTPDGHSWTGFISHAPGRALYALIFRELTSDARATFTLPSQLAFPCNKPAETLAGEGKAVLENQGTRITVHIPASQRFLFVRWTV